MVVAIPISSSRGGAVVQKINLPSPILFFAPGPVFPLESLPEFLYGDKAGNYLPPLWLELRSGEYHVCMPSERVPSHPHGLNPLESYSIITRGGWDLKRDSRTFAVVCFVVFCSVFTIYASEAFCYLTMKMYHIFAF